MAVTAVRLGALTSAGAAAAALVGALLLTAAGWAGGAALAVFFVTGSAVSRLEAGRTVLDPKGHRRDQWQVLANGGAAAAGALVAAAAGHPRLAIWTGTAALAAAAADTWATSIGSLSRRAPRHIVTGRQVPPGTGGGVSVVGTAGALAGAALVAAAAASVSRDPALFPAGVMIGMTGMLADSVLGGTVQARFHCPACRRASEWPRHRCGTATAHEGGFRWLTNDWVNGMATALAALGGAGWLALLH